MICCRLQDGPCEGLDYHFVAASTPPERIVMGRVRDDHPWTRLAHGLENDDDFRPQVYRLAEKVPVAMDDDGEPVYAYLHTTHPL